MYHFKSFLIFSFLFLVFAACKKDNSGNNPVDPTPVTYQPVNFSNVIVGQSSVASFNLNQANASGPVSLAATGPFQLSHDASQYNSSATVPAAQAATKTIYVMFSPTAIGPASGTINISVDGKNYTIALSGKGILQQTFTTFSNTRLAFGGAFNQSSEQTFNLPTDLSNYSKILMYIKLRCPSAGCNEWDMYANIQVKDNETGNYFELGRFITPYGVNNAGAGRGFEVDVTDFKSLLQGSTTLRAFIEVWGADGWLLSVDFDYITGTPDYPYYNVAKVLQYNQHSLAGVPYGEDASTFDLNKNIAIPANAAKTQLRTIISGWGHAYPLDAGGRGCAEWCFRTHNIKINGNNTFDHYLGPIGCANNPVGPQNGNWQPDRAGWCPGMEVPVRTNELASSYAGQSFSFEYYFSPWVNNMQSPADNPHAYYAISTYVVVKSNTPVAAPVVTD